MRTPENIIAHLLNIELSHYAAKLGFINGDGRGYLSNEFLLDSLSVLNILSLKKDETSKKQLIAISALLWTYKDDEWKGLTDFLLLFLSRSGFGPSSKMIDKHYTLNDDQFTAGSSLLNQFAVAVEIVRNEIIIRNKTYLLSDFQKEIWNAIDVNELLGISAPTSAGKSFIILLKSIDLLLKKEGTVVYVVPTLSLVSQVLADFRAILDAFDMVDYTLETTYSINNSTPKSIYVLTQEKAIAAFSQSEKPFQNVRLLVIDEIQNVERVDDSDDQRAKVLYDLIIEMRNNITIDHIIISGPRIINIDSLGNALFGVVSEKKETDASPVLNLTYSVNRKADKFFFSVHTDLINDVQSLEIENIENIEGYGKVRYDDNYLKYLSNILDSFHPDDANIVFSPTSTVCNTIAESIASNLKLTGSDYLRDLSRFIAETVHPNFSLVKTIEKGVAYHHGKLPFHVRALVEDGIKKKEIKNVVCTTTLLQGVNLPVQNIIIRNPNLFIRKKANSVKLTNYEIANLRGRAGRLLKDFIGRTFILDELSFKEKESSQLELFKDSSKELQVGYGKRYAENKHKIYNDIERSIGSTYENQGYSYLTTYLRQTVLRYGIGAQVYLHKVGIKMEDSELNSVFTALSNLNVNKEVCSKNRYWDPVDLDKLSKMAGSFSLPTSPSESNISYRLKGILMNLRENFPVYYYKYFGVDDIPKKDVLLQKCILAENWLKEKLLSDIFNTSYYNESNQIDEAINFIQNKISYGLPLLLKPLYDLKEFNVMFPIFIEIGAYRPVTRRLIELGVPRETAIHLTNTYDFINIDDKNSLIKQLRDVRDKLIYWHRIQLQTI